MDLDIDEQAQVMSGEEDDEDSIITNPPSILDIDGELLREAVEEEELSENEVAVLKGSVGRDSLVAAWVENGGRRGFARSYRSSSLSRGQSFTRGHWRMTSIRRAPGKRRDLADLRNLEVENCGRRRDLADLRNLEVENC